MNNKITIVIPAYNEEKTIGELIRRLKKADFSEIIVVNDGSSDRTSQIAQAEGARVLNHIINRGAGGAIRTGVALVLQREAEIAVTMDADLQHDVQDISKLLKPIEKGEADVVIGSRMLNLKNMPLRRRLANRIANFFTWLFFGIKVTDSQSGFRAFSKEALKKMRLRADHMEISSEILQEVKRNKLRLKEVPIRTIYTTYSLSKGQNLLLGFKTLIKLFFLRSK